MDEARPEPVPKSSPLAASLVDARRELNEIERDHAAGNLDTYTALALAFVAGVEHARRLLAT